MRFPTEHSTSDRPGCGRSGLSIRCPHTRYGSSTPEGCWPSPVIRHPHLRWSRSPQVPTCSCARRPSATATRPRQGCTSPAARRGSTLRQPRWARSSSRTSRRGETSSAHGPRRRRRSTAQSWPPGPASSWTSDPSGPAFHQVARRASSAKASLRGMTRSDGRTADQLRLVRFTRGWLDHAEGSVLVEFGATRVLCAASVTEGVPRWRKGSGQGWVTAEYAMLPRSTNTRSDRESVRGRIGGRTHEISRLIGRSLRAAIDLGALGENSIAIDCDVLQADGGTRTAAITGAYVALADAVSWLGDRKKLARSTAIAQSVSAVSVGVIDGEPPLDLAYEEDVAADTDMNVVCTGTGDFVEVQGTAEGTPFDRGTLDALLDLAVAGCRQLAEAQRAALAS